VYSVYFYINMCMWLCGDVPACVPCGVGASPPPTPHDASIPLLLHTITIHIHRGREVRGGLVDPYTIIRIQREWCQKGGGPM
jgi:hypothetical protein